MTNRISRRTIACALLASSAVCGLVSEPAAAQLYQPQKFRQVDANGVDVTWGDFLMNFVEGSIGSGEAKLELVRNAQYRPGSYDNNSNNLDWDRIFLNQVPASGSPTGIYINVNLGAHFEKFTGAGSLPSGSTLTASGTGAGYKYQTADGMVIDFEDPTGGSESTSQYCNGTQTQCILLPISITSPDGRTVNISWDVNAYNVPNGCREIDCNPYDTSYDTRINNVSNSFGYRVAFTYASNVGGSTTPSAEAWHKRTAASFYNDAVSTTTPQSSVSYSYPSSGVTQVTDIGGRVWQFSGTGDRVSGIRRPGASSDTTTVTYSPTTGLLTSVTREGVTTNYSRSVSGSTATMTITDPLSLTKVITSDLTVGRPTAIQDENSHTTSYTYDSNGNLTRVTQPEGNYVQYTYDSRGNVTQTTAVAKSGSGLSNIVTSASYDTTCANPVKCNEPNSTTDARGNVTDYTYDSTHGGVLTVTEPAPTTGATRPQTRYAYTLTSGEYRLTGVSACATGSSPSCVGTSDETKTTISYDTLGNGNVVSVSSGDGSGTLTATRAMTYDAVGNLLTIDGPLSGAADTTRYRYDAARNLIGVTSPDPDGTGSLKMRAIRNSYTNALLTKREIGTVNSQSDSDWAAFSTAEQVDIGYDANARVTTQKPSSGGSNYALTQLSYDSLGRSDCVATRMNPSIYGSLPSSACTLGTAGSYGNDRISQTLYDNASQVTQLKEGVGTSDAATERTLAYSNNGKVTSLTDAEGNKTSFVYDGFDRLSQTQYPNTTKGAGSSNSGDYEQLSYDANSNVTSDRLRDGNSIGFTYDALNRITAKNLPGTEPDVTYAYDNFGRPTSASQTGNSLSFTYDALSRILTEVGPQGTATSAYDLAGRRTQLTYPGSGLYVNTDYLVTGDVSAIRENGATSGVGVLASYAYDNLGNRSSVTFGNGVAQAFTYDAVSRLASLTNDLSGTTNDLSVTFAYNPAHQISSTVRTGDSYAYSGLGNVNRSYTSNGLNQYSAAGSASLSYDNRGNLTSDGTNTYGYSSENLLTSGPGSTSLAYDPALRLYQVSGTSATTRFAYDGLRMIADYDGSNALQHRYVFGPGLDEPIVEYAGSGTSSRTFLSSDERGSIISRTDSSGSLSAINRYDEYGIPGSSNAGRFQYTGQVWLPEIGMQFSKARIYWPTLGRFMQTDPIGYNGDGPNLFAYAENDPVNLTDPSGLTVKCVTVGATDTTPAHTSCSDDGGGGPGGPPSSPGALSILSGHWGGDSSGNNGGDSPGMAPADQDPIVITANPQPQPQPQAAIVVTGRRKTQVNLYLAQIPPNFDPLLPHWLPEWMMTGCMEACFEAGTLVATPSGLKPIEKLAVGDLVLSVDEETKEIAPKTVTRLIRPNPKPVYELVLRDAGGRVETFHVTADHRWEVDGVGWVATAELKAGDRIETGSKVDVTVAAVSATKIVERTFNLEVADWHTFMVGQERAIVHNAGCDHRTVADVLKTRKGSVVRAPLPPGSPSWDQIRNMTMSEIDDRARANEPGYRTIQKLLTDNRFAR